MSTRTHRTRVLLAAALTAATLTLTACTSAEGVKDEGAATGSAVSSSPTAAATPSPSPSGKASGGTSGGTGETDQAGDANGSGGSKGSDGTTGSAGSSGSGGSSGASGSDGSGRVSAVCSSVSSRMAATKVSRPLNHLLLTVTNTGSENCKLLGFPAVAFEDAQSVPPAFEDSEPQAVVTLAPGESGYASVLLSAADGGGSGHTAKSLAVHLDSDPNGAMHPSLPAQGVYIDASVQVSYWQPTMADALAW